VIEIVDNLAYHSLSHASLLVILVQSKRHIRVIRSHTGLRAGLRADELLRANIGDIRRADDGAVIHARGKGGKDRRMPIESALLDVIEQYLNSRATRLPGTAKQRCSPAGGWPPARRRHRCSWALTVTGSRAAPCSTGCCAHFGAPAFDADCARGALVHGLRHTFATELANANVSVYTLMRLLGHESMVTSQRCVTAAGTETRAAAAQNTLYGLLKQPADADG
jgi:integrase